MGLVHAYTGPAKGKTTAAVGLAVRASGAGFEVLFQQYLKADNSSELAQLKKLGITVVSGLPPGLSGFTWDFSAAEEELLEEQVQERLEQAFSFVKQEPAGPRLLVLDEILTCLELAYLPTARLIDLVELCQEPEGPELVLTGRQIPAELAAKLDYHSHLTELRHPFQKGQDARLGIEY